MGRRITRKQLKKDDEFISAGEIVLRWITMNWRPMVAGVVAVLAVAAVWWMVSLWTGARANEASLMLHRAVQTFEGENPSQGGEPTGDIDAAEQQFREVADRYGRSDHADMARLYLARIDLSRGKTDEALATLEDISRRHGSDAIGRMATLNLIDLKLGSGQGDEVVDQLKQAADETSDALPADLAMYKLARYFDDENRLEEAREYYQRLVDEYQDSPYTFLARQRLTEIG
jgi:predicted negative regulator of RcsB-dependent stress response